jgi:hypothetical protein
MGLDELLAEHVQKIHFSIAVCVHGQAPSAQSMASGAWSKTRAKPLGGVAGCGCLRSASVNVATIISTFTVIQRWKRKSR